MRSGRDLADAALREAAWLDADRARAWLRVTAVAMAVLAAIVVSGQLAGGRWGGLGRDFNCFWAAGHLAAQGDPAAAYDRPAMMGLQLHMPQNAGGRYQPFMYPPPFLLFCAGIGALPYWPGFVAFMAAGLVPLVLAVRRILPGREILPVLAFPGVLFCIICGQNGLMSAACFAGFTVWADRRPALAGACLGLLAYKPQLAACAPLVLLAAGRWRSLAGAAVTYAAACLASLAVLGPAAWRAFLAFGRAGHSAFDVLALEATLRARIDSAMEAVILMGGRLGVAEAVQAVVSLATLGAMIWFARQRPSGAALGAAMAAGAILTTPYILDYDLVCLAPALAWLVAQGSAAGWRPYGRVVVASGFVLPLGATMLAMAARIQLAPLVVAAVFAAVLGAGLAQAGRATGRRVRGLSPA